MITMHTQRNRTQTLLELPTSHIETSRFQIEELAKQADGYDVSRIQSVIIHGLGFRVWASPWKSSEVKERQQLLWGFEVPGLGYHSFMLRK